MRTIMRIRRARTRMRMRMRMRTRIGAMSAATTTTATMTTMRKIAQIWPGDPVLHAASLAAALREDGNAQVTRLLAWLPGCCLAAGSSERFGCWRLFSARVRSSRFDSAILFGNSTGFLCTWFLSIGHDQTRGSPRIFRPGILNILDYCCVNLA